MKYDTIIRFVSENERGAKLLGNVEREVDFDHRIPVTGRVFFSLREMVRVPQWDSHWVFLTGIIIQNGKLRRRITYPIL